VVPELEWLELARTDLLGIVDYISDDNPDAAQRVKYDIEMKAKKCTIRKAQAAACNNLRICFGISYLT
jgi:plasmid stabilization system protein ParE